MPAAKASSHYPKGLAAFIEDGIGLGSLPIVSFCLREIRTLDIEVFVDRVVHYLSR